MTITITLADRNGGAEILVVPDGPPARRALTTKAVAGAFGKLVALVEE